jgi:hypothetical protein
MPSTVLSFTAPYLLLKQITSRDPKGAKKPGATAKRDLERWYGVLSGALERLKLDPAEAVLLLQVLGTVDASPEEKARLLAVHVERDTAEGYGHVRRELVRKMTSWDLLTCWAVVDAAERYVVYQQRNPGATLGMALHQVGLHSYEATYKELAALEATTAVVPAELEAPQEEGPE